jgi:hypothetical protein
MLKERSDVAPGILAVAPAARWNPGSLAQVQSYAETVRTDRDRRLNPAI